MSDIYRYNIYDRRDIMSTITDIRHKLDEERAKPDINRNREAEFNLLYAQFLWGLKLSTGSIL